MKARKLHRLLGVVLLLPFLGWATTGFVFFLKPGYTAAYENLPIKAYPLTEPCALSPAARWLEVRCLRTVLGNHLLARTDAGWQQIAPADGRPRGRPTARESGLLLEDASERILTGTGPSPVSPGSPPGPRPGSRSLSTGTG